jgi:cobalamin biosynthesis Co2+ chelatase CbiK
MIENKAILVVSFGTSHKETREKTIDQIEYEIGNAFPEYKIYRAFTSNMIIKILKNRDNLSVFTVAEAMDRMRMDGITHVIVQPTHILNGIENDNMKNEICAYLKYFTSLKLGNPLLTSTEDYKKVIENFIKDLVTELNTEALVFMGHGTAHYANTSYAAFEYMLKAYGYEDVYMATVEAYPGILDCLQQLKKKTYTKIVLTPFMIVSGDHATNDMAGDEEDSWKSILENEGYEVSCSLKGLGEYQCIRDIFVQHVRAAVDFPCLEHQMVM